MNADSYETLIVDGRMIFNGVPVDDIIDHVSQTYSQSNRLTRSAAIARAFRAGLLVAKNAARYVDVDSDDEIVRHPIK